MKNQGIAPAGYYDDEYARRDWTAYSGLLAKIIQHSKPGPILDVGAGCGYLVEAAMTWGLESVGVEGSEEGVRIAKQRVQDINISHHKLSEPLPFYDSSFQTVVLNQVIEHLEPSVVEFTMKEIYRVLRPGGMFLILSPSKANKKEWHADPTHINLLSPTELRLELANCGFENVVPFDSPLTLLGKNWLGIRIMFVLFKLLKLDSLSGTANAFAYKKTTAATSS